MTLSLELSFRTILSLYVWMVRFEDLIEFTEAKAPEGLHSALLILG